VDTNTSTGAITPGRTNTAISIATTTSIAGSPAAGVQRNIKTLHVRNTHTTLAADVTVQHTDGTVVAQLYKMTMLPSNMLEYTDQGGFSRGGAVTTTAILGGRLTWVSATQLKFSPYEGGYIKLNGVLRAIPNAGIAGLANTSVRVNGVAGQNLAANSIYLLNATDVNGVLTGDFWTVPTSSHGRSTAPGNEGTEIRTSGDGLTEYQTHTLIGMVHTNGAAQFQDDTSFRGVLSWFNRQTKSILISGGIQGGVGTTSAEDIQIGTVCHMLNFAGEATSATVYANSSLDNTDPSVFAHIKVARDSPATPHGGSLYIYGAISLVPASVGGLDTPSEGSHAYFCACGGGTNLVATMYVFNGTLTGFTRG
jgi:hypothetical protein